jgi:hypothetical protein
MKPESLWIALLLSTNAVAQAVVAPVPSPTPAEPAATMAAPSATAIPAPPSASSVRFSGFTYIDVGYTTPDPSAYYSGRNNGLRILNLRLEMSGSPAKDFGFEVSLDAAVDRRSDTTSLIGRKEVQLRDGYVWFDVTPRFRITVGQFKMPYGAEALLPDEELPFVRRSIVSAGQFASEGRDVAGMWLDRQLGVSLRYATPKGDSPGFSVELVGANHNGANQVLNDNSKVPLMLGRVEGRLGERLTLGLNAYFNPRTIADDKGVFFDETDLAYGADLTAHLGPLKLMVMGLRKTTQYVTTGASSALAYGVVAQALWTLPDQFFGAQLGYRFAFYEPNNTIGADKLNEHDFLIAYPFPRMPVRLILQVSLRGEEPLNEINNNGVDLMMQALF